MCTTYQRKLKNMNLKEYLISIGRISDFTEHEQPKKKDNQDESQLPEKASETLKSELPNQAIKSSAINTIGELLDFFKEQGYKSLIDAGCTGVSADNWPSQTKMPYEN